MMNWSTGIRGIAGSKKAMMCVLIIVISSILAYLGKLDTAYAAVMSVVGSIYCFTVQRTEVAAMGVQNVQ